MQTAVFMDIQRRHVEQSRWTNIREYAAEVLRREEAKKSTKSRRNSSSQQKSVSRKTINSKQQARCPVLKASAPVVTNEKNRQDTAIPNDVAYHQLEQIILKDSNTNHAIPVDGFVQSIPASPATNDLGPYGTKDTDGVGMDDESFQELLKAVEKGLQIISRPNAVNATPGSVNPALTCYTNYHRRGIVTRDSLSVGSQRSCNESQNYLSSCLNAMGTEDDISLQRGVTGLNVTAGKDKQYTNTTEPRTSAKGGLKGPNTASQARSDGVSKKGKPKKKLGSLKKKDFLCPYDGCGKAFERRYNLKVHTRRHTGEMPYTCPKTSDGCFLYFRWRSSLRHHLKTVHNDVVPISQNTVRASTTPTAVTQTTNATSGKNTSASPSLSASKSSIQSCGTPVLGVLKNDRIIKTSRKKQGKTRKNFPAVALRQPTAQELAQLGIASVSKSSFPAAPSHSTERMVHGKSGFLAEKDTMKATRGNSPATETDLIDISSFLTTESEMNDSPSLTNEEDDIYKGMDVDIPDHLALPTLCDLPAPEEFFLSA